MIFLANNEKVLSSAKHGICPHKYKKGDKERNSAMDQDDIGPSSFQHYFLGNSSKIMLK